MAQAKQLQKGKKSKQTSAKTKAKAPSPKGTKQPPLDWLIQQASLSPHQLKTTDVAHLQRTIGNQAMGRLNPALSQQAEGTAAIAETSLQGILDNSHNVVSRKTDKDGDKGVADKISTQDIQYEIVAHHIAYQDKISPAAGQILARWGYLPHWTAKIKDDSTGFFVGLIMPHEDHPELTPILAFRGTEPSQLGDIASDLHPSAVGRNQFRANQLFIKQLILEAGGKVDVTGHSLGGALAQHTAATFAGNINRVVTFQAPAINASTAKKFDEAEGDHSATHHIAGGDVVDVAGRRRLSGDVFSHSPGGFITPHVKFLLLSPEFKERREALGLDDDTLKQLGIEPGKNKRDIKHDETYPHPIKSALAETGRALLGMGLYPILDAINTLLRDDDKGIRNEVASLDEGELAQRSTAERSYMVSRLLKGVTLNADENTILTILQASQKAGDLVQVVNIANAWEICKAVDGDQYEKLRQFLNEHYYPNVEFPIALQLIQACMDGGTDEWEEEMIADILVTHDDGRQLITQIGKIYADGGFVEGLNKIEWQLDGEDQKRVNARYGKSGRWW